MRHRVLASARFAAVAATLALSRRAVATEPAGVASGDAAGLPDGAAPPAGGIDPRAVVAGPSLCPRPAEVWSALQTLMPRERLEERARALRSPVLPFEIVDLGPLFRVTAGERARDYQDQARDCAYRARLAAVFIALALDPAGFPAALPAAVSSPPPASPAPPRMSPPIAAPSIAPAPPPPAPAPRPRAASLELGAAVEAGVASGDLAPLAGLSLRVAAGRGTWALVAGLSALAPADVTIGGQRVRQLLVPADVGLRAQLPGRRVELSAELGLGASLLSERALDLATNQNRSAVEFGARLAGGVRFSPAARIAPFVAVLAELVPSPAELYALPQGTLGHTAALWIGATAGASLGF